MFFSVLAGAASEELFELAMSFTMVALFSGVCPLAGAVTLLSNAIEARLDSLKFLRCR